MGDFGASMYGIIDMVSAKYLSFRYLDLTNMISIFPSTAISIVLPRISLKTIGLTNIQYDITVHLGTHSQISICIYTHIYVYVYVYTHTLLHWAPYPHEHFSSSPEYDHELLRRTQ